MRILNLFLFTLGRVLLSVFFIGLAVKKILFFSSAQGSLIDAYSVWISRFFSYNDTLLDFFISASGVLLWMTIIAEIILGALLLLGNHMRITTMSLGIYLFVSACFLYPFWLLSGPSSDLAAMMFIRNGAIAGGLLCLTTHYAPAQVSMRADFPLDDSNPY